VKLLPDETPRDRALRQTRIRLDRITREHPAEMFAAAQALAGAKGDEALARARVEATSILPKLTPAVLRLLEDEVRRVLEPTARKTVEREFGPRDEPPEPPPPDALPSDDATLARRARERVAVALDVGDVRGAQAAARTAAILGALPTPRETSAELDYSRLTDAELGCLEALVEVARGNRPSPSDDGEVARWLDVVSRA